MGERNQGGRMGGGVCQRDGCGVGFRGRPEAAKIGGGREGHRYSAPREARTGSEGIPGALRSSGKGGEG